MENIEVDDNNECCYNDPENVDRNKFSLVVF